MPKSLPDVFEPPMPELVEAEGAREVDSLKLLHGATIRVCYDGMLRTDRIAVCWESRPGECAPIEPQYGVDAGCVDFDVEPFDVGLRLDAIVKFSYTVTRDGETHPSRVAEVRIKLPSNLPAPEFLQATDGVLDLSLLCCRDPVVSVAPWAFINNEQSAGLYLSGTYAGGGRFYEEFFKGEKITDEEVLGGWSRPLPMALLKQLEHNSRLILIFDVKLHGHDNSFSRLFPSSTTTLLTLPHLELGAPNVVQAVECTPGEFSLNPINAKDGATLRVAYDHPCPNDNVCAYWKGTAGPGTPYLGCQEMGTKGFIDFVVPASSISANLQETVTVCYTVQRGREMWQSPSRDIHVLNISDLPMPDVSEATGKTLDLNTFSGDAEITVHPWWLIDEVHPRWLWVTGISEGDTPYSIDVLQGQSGPRTGVSEILLRSELLKLSDCSTVYVHFAVNFNGRLDKASAEAFPVLALELVQPDLVLDAPTVREAVGSDLTVWNARNGAIVRVQYPRMSARDMISVCWKQEGACLPCISKQGNSDPGYVEFPVSRNAVIHGINKTIPINFTVERACQQATSMDLELNISTPVRLPEPTVLEVTESVLDMRTFLGDAHVSLDAWWFILPGQLAWLECLGTGEDGLPYTIKVITGEKIEQDGQHKLQWPIERDELLKFKDKTSLLIQFKVTADGDPNVGNAIVFPTSIITRFTKKMLDATEFIGENWNGWAPGGGASHPEDLKIKTDPDGRVFLFDWGYTDTSNPLTQREKLVKVYNNLEPGFRYEFRADVRNNSGASPPPKIGLVANGVDIYPATVLASRVWMTISGTFIANSTTARLSIDNLQMGKQGNDFDMSRIILEEIS